MHHALPVFTRWRFLSYISQETDFRVHSFNRQNLFLRPFSSHSLCFSLFLLPLSSFVLFYGSLCALMNMWIFAGEKLLLASVPWHEMAGRVGFSNFISSQHAISLLLGPYESLCNQLLLSSFLRYALWIRRSRLDKEERGYWSESKWRGGLKRNSVTEKFLIGKLFN